MNNDGALILADAIYYIQKLRVSAQVRESHLEKNGKQCELTSALIDRTQVFEDWLNSELRDFVQKHPAYPWFNRVKGIGDINIGKVVCLIDIEKASQVSKLWRFAGFGCGPDGLAERQKKGEKLHYNKVLKSMCWRLGKSLIRAKGKYYEFYKVEKERIAERISADGTQIVPSANLPKENGKHVEGNGYFGLGHVDMMAMRKMIKLFLSHLWLAWREGAGLSVTRPYVHDIKGHTDFIHPEEMCE